MNNKQPQFEGLDPTLSNSYRGSVPENEDAGKSVITVKAVDPDLQEPNNVVKKWHKFSVLKMLMVFKTFKA